MSHDKELNKEASILPDYAARMLMHASSLIIDRPHSHGIFHASTVLAYAIKIAYMEEWTDERTLKFLVPIAIYHDHWDHKYMRGVDAERNTAVMKDAVRIQLKAFYDYTDEEVGLIIEEIDLISYSKGKTPNTISGMIVQDADRLTAIGPMGIIRCAYYGAENGLDPEHVIRHIDDKLLKLGDTMKFESTKWYARVQNLNMIAFRDLFNVQSQFAGGVLDKLNEAIKS